MKLQQAQMRLVVCVLLTACLDLSPVRYDAARNDAGVTPGPDASDDDSGATDAAMGSSAECRECLATGPCSEPLATCNADTKCAAFAACMSDADCWTSHIDDLNNVPMCVTECGMMAGFTSQVDPSSVLIVPVLICAQDPERCASTCAPSFLP
jgi:hypothetical protein